MINIPPLEESGRGEERRKEDRERERREANPPKVLQEIEYYIQHI